MNPSNFLIYWEVWIICCSGAKYFSRILIKVAEVENVLFFHGIEVCCCYSMSCWCYLWNPIPISLREKFPNTEFFLVRIFPHSDWIRRDTEYVLWGFRRCVKFGINFWNFKIPLASPGRFQKIQKISLVIFFQISFINMWLLV